MKKKLLSSFLHILLFVVIEVCFVFVILHEFPEIGLFEKLGVVHIVYWILIFIAGYVRESIENYKVRFLSTFLPVVFHIVGHLYIGEETIHHIEEHAHASDFWLIVSTIILGIFIFLGEYLLHKRYHCESHHHKVHKHCKEE